VVAVALGQILEALEVLEVAVQVDEPE